MRAKYISKKKETVAWDYYLDGTYFETRYYRSWVYKRADGSEFLCLEYPKAVKRDYKSKPFVVQRAYTNDSARYLNH